ncbi:hypothetical protein B0H14DRAFT_3870910 [Mycena olivaceomarginata]|nr:hypothetical protein B0H14DRAFT_3870910 [Mycena olivaceomarginata]
MSIGQTVVQNETSSQLWLNILGIWVATFLYGVFCVLFGRCVFILFNRMRQLERQGILLGATILLFALSSGQIVVLTINVAIMVGQSDLNPDQMLNALESGVLYTVFVSVHFALFSVGSPIAPIMFSAVSQIVGIAPTLIFVRVGVEPKPASSVSTNV